MAGLPFSSGAAAAIFYSTVGAWVLTELWVGLRTRRSTAPRRDRGSRLIVGLGLYAAVLLAVQVAERWPGGTMPWPWLPFAAGVVLWAGGLGLRLWAVRTLGRWFTTTVRVATDQEVVDSGPYAWVRHPSYLGLLLLVNGLGLECTDWLSVAATVLIPLPPLVWRIRIEETALADVLGAAYRDYAEGRSRLLPGIW